MWLYSPGGGSITIGAIDTQTASSNGLVASGSNLYAQSANTINPGLVNTGSQTFTGVKIFNAGLIVDVGASLSNDYGGNPAIQIGINNRVNSGNGSFMLGNNNLGGNKTLQVGRFNDFYNSGTMGSNSFSVGYLNVSNGNCGFLAGQSNTVTSGASPDFIALLGANLTVGAAVVASQVVVGEWNVDDANQVFVVANGTGAGAKKNIFTVGTGGDAVHAGNVTLSLAGNGLKIKEGTNARMGVATLAAGTSGAIANTSITATTRVFLTVQGPGGTQGFLSVARVNGTSFTINSTSGTETSTVAWLLVEAA